LIAQNNTTPDGVLSRRDAQSRERLPKDRNGAPKSPPKPQAEAFGLLAPPGGGEDLLLPTREQLLAAAAPPEGARSPVRAPALLPPPDPSFLAPV
jgi:hypothetical protein